MAGKGVLLCAASLQKLFTAPMSKEASLVAAVLAAGFLLKKVTANKESSVSPHKDAEKPKKKRLNFSQFLRQVAQLRRIVLPHWKTREFLLLALHTAVLCSRSFLSIAMIWINGKIAKTIVDEDPRAFGINILTFMAMAVPSAYVNSMIKFLEAKLDIAFRSRLAAHCRRMYMADQTYYRIENLDNRLANADQSLTEDIANFSKALAHLWSQLSKPVLDLTLTIGQLLWIHRQGVQAKSVSSQNGPWFTAAIGLSAVFMTMGVLRAFSPPFGRLVAEQARLEGSYRAVHSRLINTSEEVAFLGGHDVEEGHLVSSYDKLTAHVNKILKLKIRYNFLEDFTMKYSWNAAGMAMIAVPTLLKTNVGVDPSGASARAQDFITSKSLMINLSDAVERLMSSYKEVTELAGYTSRVVDMLDTFEDVKKGRFQKASSTSVDMTTRGRMATGDNVVFDSVPIVTPAGDVLVSSMSFHIEPGMHLLIVGPNGCGKSSLFRILGGLWPIFGGSVTRPADNDLFYIPQKPYMVTGTLRDQITYPETHAEMTAKGGKDEDLMALLDVVNLGPVVAREGGWDSVKSWGDSLSGGEKQRIAMARLFYHHPRYAILDECTSAVSFDIEAAMYSFAKELNITLLTVSHRHTLWQYHTHILQYDGAGGYAFKPLDASERLNWKEEKSRLEATLIDVPAYKKRLEEICAILGEDSAVLTEVRARSGSLEGPL